MLLLLHRLKRKRRKMPRQARQLSGTGICQGLRRWYSPVGKIDKGLVWYNTKNVAYEK